MIHLRRSTARRLDPVPVPEVWHTFHEGLVEPEQYRQHFHALELLDEARLPPGAALPVLDHARLERVTYVFHGGLASEDALGRPGLLLAGEFRRIAVDPVHGRHERNASATDWVHLFQLGLRPHSSGPLTPGDEQRRFSVAERRNRLCLVASPEEGKGALHLDQNVRLYSGCLDEGQHVAHELLSGRVAWLHVVQGELDLGELRLSKGDGAWVSEERAVSVTARSDVEVLLVDVSDERSGGRNGSS